MKTQNYFYALALLITVTSCDANETASNENLVTASALNVIAVDDAVIQSIRCTDSTTFSQTITEEEKSGLLLMREEEKLAHDVYVYFYNLYNNRVFNNISKSETQHTGAVLRLINFYGLTDPATKEKGVYTNVEIQELYKTLTAQGSTMNDALSTGAFIEEYDIKDLQDLLAETQNPTIKMVYSNLLKGSVNHLKAFTRVLKFYGITYVPTILSKDEYDKMISK